MSDAKSSNHVVNNTVVVNHNNIVINYVAVAPGCTMAGQNVVVPPPPKHLGVSWRFKLLLRRHATSPQNVVEDWNSCYFSEI